MNGADLPPAHGFPLRAVVPGWYGMASIKWLRRLVVTDQPFNGYFQSIDYSYISREKGLCKIVPITEMQVKAQIARPSAGETIPADTVYRIHGAAWTGASEIAKVELSTDGGKSWEEIKRFSEDMPQNRDIRSFAWRLWSYDWHTPKKTGEVRIMVRATDSKGRIQPLDRDPDRRNYMISHVRPVDVVIQ